jgi:hypothetical protein
LTWRQEWQVSTRWRARHDWQSGPSGLFSAIFLRFPQPAQAADWSGSLFAHPWQRPFPSGSRRVIVQVVPHSSHACVREAV